MVITYVFKHSSNFGISTKLMMHVEPKSTPKYVPKAKTIKMLMILFLVRSPKIKQNKQFCTKLCSQKNHEFLQTILLFSERSCQSPLPQLFLFHDMETEKQRREVDEKHDGKHKFTTEVDEAHRKTMIVEDEDQHHRKADLFEDPKVTLVITSTHGNSNNVRYKIVCIFKRGTHF